MTSMANTMAGTAVGLGGVALVGRAAQMANANFDLGPRKGGKRKRKRKANMVGGFTDLMVGTALLGGAASVANAVP